MTDAERELNEICPLWCRGVEEVLQISPQLRHNYTKGRDEILLKHNDEISRWHKCEIDMKKKKAYCEENRKTYDISQEKFY